MSLTDALGVKGNINQGQAAADEAIDRAKDAASQIVQVTDTDVQMLVNGLEDKLTAAVQPVLAELQKANESIARLTAVAEKITGGVHISFGGTK